MLYWHYNTACSAAARRCAVLWQPAGSGGLRRDRAQQQQRPQRRRRHGEPDPAGCPAALWAGPAPGGGPRPHAQQRAGGATHGHHAAGATCHARSVGLDCCCCLPYIWHA